MGVGSEEAADLRKGLGEGWGDEVGRLKRLQEGWANGEEGEGAWVRGGSWESYRRDQGLQITDPSLHQVSGEKLRSLDTH